jgi:hypothetical protein
MMTLKEAKAWNLERGYTCKYLTNDETQYFMDSYLVLNKRKYEGKVCKFTGNIYGVLDLHSEMLVGYMTEYKTSSGKKVFDQHRL